ncbi:DHH family phosphoesterase [Candidatus Micrarchaeota archaeon]|nr:DHH family phosphoesterase [Candidatus Micrarchaeota archaeon]MBU2476932.1 DHH family phosphoesterase [Candidatus Micrarchaeota archaeon]
MGGWEKLKERNKLIASEIKKRDDFVIVNHHDADGLCAGAIIAKALERKGKKFTNKTTKQLYSETIKEIKEMGKNFIFVDFGSGQMDLLEENIKENFFVIDHHQPKQSEYKFHSNPFFFGFDGGNEISGSGMTYLLAKELNEKNKDLSVLAVVGAVGDMQDFKGKLEGINRKILEDAEKTGMIKKENDLRLYGRISRPLTQFISYSSNPVFPGLAADDKASAEFISENGIELRQGDKWRTYSDLNEKEKKKFTSALIMHLIQNGFSEWKAKNLIGETYTLLKENPKSPLRDAKEFATLLNSCGRNGQPEIGLAVCMGDRINAYQNAMELLLEHRRQLREGIEWVHKNGVEEEKAFYFFDSGENIKEEIVGIIAGMLYGSKLIGQNKPIIAFAKQSEDLIKVSARATEDLVEKGLNLGKLLRESCSELGGKAEGGGHKIAAGCRISKEQQKEFKEKLNDKIESQMQN